MKEHGPFRVSTEVAEAPLPTIRKATLYGVRTGLARTGSLAPYPRCTLNSKEFARGKSMR